MALMSLAGTAPIGRGYLHETPRAKGAFASLRCCLPCNPAVEMALASLEVMNPWQTNGSNEPAIYCPSRHEGSGKPMLLCPGKLHGSSEPAV